MASAAQHVKSEWAMLLWPNKDVTAPRPPPGSGYNRLKPIMPHKRMVPAAAPAELRLNANVIPGLFVLIMRWI
jgi:hypothetical protein